RPAAWCAAFRARCAPPDKRGAPRAARRARERFLLRGNAPGKSAPASEARKAWQWLRGFPGRPLEDHPLGKRSEREEDAPVRLFPKALIDRSEEHTSELQSR